MKGGQKNNLQMEIKNCEDCVKQFLHTWQGVEAEVTRVTKCKHEADCKLKQENEN